MTHSELAPTTASARLSSMPGVAGRDAGVTVTISSATFTHA